MESQASWPYMWTLLEGWMQSVMPYRSMWTSQAGAEVPHEKHDEAVRWGPRMRMLVPQRTNMLRPTTSDGAQRHCDKEPAVLTDCFCVSGCFQYTQYVMKTNPQKGQKRAKLLMVTEVRILEVAIDWKGEKKGPSVVNKYILLELCFMGLYIFKNSPSCTLKNSPFYTLFCIYVIPQ